mmetsp:Transcript_34418/g.65768  ORF Transcript_34418/g.65768 Transcript_34418/m.65768 type:complete len:217 (-) Transcript_34418:110-760(-)
MNRYLVGAQDSWRRTDGCVRNAYCASEMKLLWMLPGIVLLLPTHVRESTTGTRGRRCPSRWHSALRLHRAPGRCAISSRSPHSRTQGASTSLALLRLLRRRCSTGDLLLLLLVGKGMVRLRHLLRPLDLLLLICNPLLHLLVPHRGHVRLLLLLLHALHHHGLPGLCHRPLHALLPQLGCSHTSPPCIHAAHHVRAIATHPPIRLRHVHVGSTSHP